jgi:murein endopeptidase
MSAVALAAAIATAAQAPPEVVPVPEPQLARVVAPSAALLAAPDAGAFPAGQVFRGQMVSVDAVAGDQEHVVRADGVAGWLGPGATEPGPACAPRAIGFPFRGRLRCGWALAAQSDTWATWDFPLGRSPNRHARRYGTDALVTTIERVAGAFHAAHPDRRLLVGDLSRRHGGPFGRHYGGPGHASHQNGLDVDIYFPRRDGLEAPAERPSDVDLPLAREVVQRFAAQRTQYLFVGCRRNYLLRGVRKVQRLCNGYHENHVHVRLRPPAPAR